MANPPSGSPPMAHNRASRPTSPSTSAGQDGEGSEMQGVIRSQMMSIMKPVAEHVRELHAQVQQLFKNLSLTDGRIDETKVTVDQMHQDVLALHKGLSKTDAQVDKLQSEHSMTHREKDRLHADHEVTKSDLAKIAGNLRTSNVLLKAIQQKSEDLDGDVRALQMGAAKLGRSVLEETDKMVQVREFTEGLNARHLDMVKDINGLGRSGAEMERNMHKLGQCCDKADSVMRSELAHHKEHMHSFNNRLTSMQHDMQHNLDAIKGLDAQVRTIKAALDQEEGSSRNLDSLFILQDKASETIKNHGDGLGKLQAAISSLQDAATTNKASTENLCKDLCDRVMSNSSHVDSLETQLRFHGESFKKNEAQLGKFKQSLDVIGEQVDMAQLDLKGLHAAQTDTANKVEIQRIALAKVQADVEHGGSEVEATNEKLGQLKDGLANLDMTIAKLGSRYDSCTKNIQGVSKGLADVSRHVNQGDHGLLPPKSPHSRRLPSLLNSTGSTMASTSA